ncbi:MAG: magnesium transporter [Clostridia bacterium]|nr:magnesium transporter [Clostridia bacterium]
MEELDFFAEGADLSLLYDELATLLEEKKYARIREILNRLPAADISELLGRLPEEKLTLAFRLLRKETAAEVFVEMEAEEKEHLISCFSDRELKEILDELYLDDTVDTIEEMPANVVARILKNSTPAARRTINELLKYPADTAGSIMTTEFVSLKKDMTVKEAFAAIRSVALDKETVYTCYITDAARHLEGVVTVKTLLISDPTALVSELMETSVISAHTLSDREEVAQMFDRYNFLALPVTDSENRLVGIVTVDDAIDVLQEEAEADFAVLSAVTPTETPYLKTGVLSIFKTRIPWLLLLLLSATFTGMIISSFEEALSACVALTAFIPMLMGTGGNAGSQASVTVVRGLSLGEIDWRDSFRVILKELRVALFCGISLALTSFVKVLLIDRLLMGNEAVTVQVSLVVSLTLLVTVLCAKLVGAFLPILAKKIKLDPAVVAGPFITTAIDALALLVYFGVASSLLHL